jgi:hypothetical protein
MRIDRNGNVHGAHDGKFKLQGLAESGVNLADDGMPSEAQSLEKLTDLYGHTYGNREAAERSAQDLIDRACVAAGPDVPREWVAAVVEADRRLAERGGDLRSPIGTWSIDSPEAGSFLREAHATGMPADWPDQMAARGDSWRYGCVKSWGQGLTDVELDRLDGGRFANSPHQARSFVGCDLEALDAWNEAMSSTPGFSQYARRYLDYQGIGEHVRDAVPLQDVLMCHQLEVEPGLARYGLTRPDGTVETGPDAIRELAAYAKACGQSTDEARQGIKLGVPASDVKAFGPKVPVAEIAGLQAMGVPAKVARSLRGKDGRLPVTTIAELNRAGITTGAGYKAWAAVTQREADPVAAACALSRSGVPVEVATRLHGQQVPAAAIPALYAGGIDNLSVWSPHATRRTQTLDAGQDPALALIHIGNFARDGGTVEQFARAQKAGVPLGDLGAHVRSTPAQLWEAGTANRDAVMATERRRHEQWGPSYADAPKPWLAPWPVDGPDGL